MYCSNCKTEVEDNANFCPNCGTEFTALKFNCTNCGVEVDEHAAFCPICGAKFSEDIVVYNHSESSEPRTSFLTWLIIAFIIGAAIGVFENFSSFSKLADNYTSNVISESVSSTKTVLIYIDSLPYGVDHKYQNALREAISFWEKNQNVVFKEVKSKNEAQVIVEWIKEFGTEKLGHANKNFAEIGVGDSQCLNKWKPYSYETVLQISKHELGHVLGYPDDYNNADSIMYYQTTTKYETDIEETEILPANYLRWYPVCTKNSVATYSFEVASSMPITIYVVPSNEDVELIKNRKPFKQYPNCLGDKINVYKKICTIPKGSYIVLDNYVGKLTSQFTLKAREI